MSSETFDRSGGSARQLSVVLVNQRREISRLARLVDEFGAASGLTDENATDLNLMLDEIVGNVIKHGYDDGLQHQIHVTVRLEGDLATLQVEDDGKPFNPLDVQEPDLNLPIEERPIGGLGVFVVKSIADSLEYARDHGRNRVTMKKRMSSNRS
jgi:anti-sigma regulatory factor (Ser/Thr protein kinase)